MENILKLNENGSALGLRELARQIYEMSKPLMEYEGIDAKLFVGGDDIEKSRKKLQKGKS